MLTKDEVKRVAKLAMLELKKDDVERFHRQFNEILNYMEQINELDLSKQEAAFHVTKLQNVFREDVVRDSTDNEAILKNAPDAAYGAFRVPKVIER